MSITESARGVRKIEYRMFGINRLISIYFTNEKVYKYEHGELISSNKIDASWCLQAALVANKNKTLLWTCADMGGNCFLFTFGYDLFVGHEKAGHGALMHGATIAGEIRMNCSRWILSNQSGAWGAMGGERGKTAKLNELSGVLNNRLYLHFVSQRAFSRHAWKRETQKKIRGVRQFVLDNVR